MKFLLFIQSVFLNSEGVHHWHPGTTTTDAERQGLLYNDTVLNIELLCVVNVPRVRCSKTSRADLAGRVLKIDLLLQVQVQTFFQSVHLQPASSSI